ncbi:recombination protein RecO [Campylobacterota bacterium]|nr:recombination protein RecO [Campylobacterota bacterium]
MRGYILNLKKHREEDVIAAILCPDRLFSLYRFYGARHSPLQLGHKIDFVAENDPFFMPRLRQVSHLGFNWLFDIERVRAWQQFCKLLFAHLRQVEEIDPFYYDLLDRAGGKLETMHPKRTMIEAAIELFNYEGRLHTELRCHQCGRVIDDDFVALQRACLPAHTLCIYADGFDRRKLARLFETGESLLFNDQEIASLWRVILEGL